MSGELVLMGHVARLHYLQGLWTATSFPDRGSTKIPFQKVRKP
jgi:hypothetical protein